MADDGWEKVGMSPIWDYKNKKKGDELIATYNFKEEGIGDNNSTLYTLELPDGSPISVWGSTLLETRFKNLKSGELVKIVYLGQEESPNRKGKYYHNFDVFHRAVTFTKVEEVGPDDVPADL